jgi:Alr-MurF fusion protein
MLNYTLNDIKKILNANIYGNDNILITSVLTDSRVAHTNSNSLFVALVGQNHNGHCFIEEMASKGVVAFLVSQLGNLPSQFPNATFLHVDNTLLALQQLAAYHRSKFSYQVIGITGSNGKTIVKEWLAQLLSPERSIVRSPKSFNSQLGVPLSVLLMASDNNLAIFEAGISMPNEMEHLESIIHPQIGIFTNLGQAHQENFADLNSKCREKMKLFTNSNVLIYCKEHNQIDLLAIEEAKKRNLQLFTWGRSADANIQISEIANEGIGCRLVVRVNQKDEVLHIPFSDEASVENAMHCFTTAIYLGVNIDAIKTRMERLQQVAMRLELKEGINGCTIINDSYNSDLGSLSIALDFLGRQHQHSKKIVILSDILQSGKSQKSLYSDVARLTTEKGIDKFIGIGPDICRNSNLFPDNSEFYLNTDEFINAFNRSKYNSLAILIKGSRPFMFERISSFLEQKTHRTILEINLNALAHNLSYFRSLLKPNVKVMVMVKAFSYGSGSHEIASLLQFNRVDYLGVAFPDEGIALREGGITLPIVVLNPTFGSYDVMIDYNLEPEIFSFASLNSFAAAVKRRGLSSYSVHLKIDTGMHRLGFLESDIDELIQVLKEEPSLKVSSIFSHLVATDDSNHDEFTKWQISQFEAVSQRISSSLGIKPLMHILNSAGIERFSHAQFDMIRLGIGIYGISACHQHRLQNVSSLKTYIAQLKSLSKDETVGYNRRGVLTRNSIIATIPIGYADGLNRKLGNGVGSVMIRGVLAPTIGNISMDTCMVDVTDIKGVEEGDEAIVFGDEPTISQIARQIDTIPYEVLTSISRRVNRVYIQE